MTLWKRIKKVREPADCRRFEHPRRFPGGDFVQTVRLNSSVFWSVINHIKANKKGPP